MLKAPIGGSCEPRPTHSDQPSSLQHDPLMQTSTTIAAKPCRGDPSGVSAASTPIPIRHINAHPSLDYLRTPFHCPLPNPPSNSPVATDRAVALWKEVLKGSDRWFVRAAPHTLRPTVLLFTSAPRSGPKILSRRSPAEGTPPGFRQHPPNLQRPAHGMR